MKFKRSFLSLLLVAIAAAAPVPPIHAAPDDAKPQDWELPKPQEEVLKTLSDVAERFGADAVMMQSYLLNEAARNGLILEATIHKPTIEERHGRKHVCFVLDSGIIFNDTIVSPAERIVRIWRNIVERSLRRYDKIDLPGDAIGVTIRYHHRKYVDETDLREHIVEEGRGDPESAAFYFTKADMIDMVRNKITAQELLDRSEALLNDQPYHLVLPPPEPTPTPDPLPMDD